MMLNVYLSLWFSLLVTTCTAYFGMHGGTELATENSPDLSTPKPEENNELEIYEHPHELNHQPILNMLRHLSNSFTEDQALIRHEIESLREKDDDLKQGIKLLWKKLGEIDHARTSLSHVIERNDSRIIFAQTQKGTQTDASSTMSVDLLRNQSVSAIESENHEFHSQPNETSIQSSLQRNIRALWREMDQLETKIRKIQEQTSSTSFQKGNNYIKVIVEISGSPGHVNTDEETSKINDQPYIYTNSTYFYKPEVPLRNDETQNLQSWSSARSLCQKTGGDLARIVSNEENTAVAKLCDSVPVECWIGLSSSSNNTFYWTDNSTLTYYNWQMGEPSQTGFGRAEHCVLIQSENEKWNNYPCNRTLSFVCSKPLVTS